MRELNRESLDLIVNFETGGRSYYEKFLSRPSYPGLQSGVTLGVGVDIGWTPKTEVEKMFGQYLNKTQMKKLLSFVGIRGPSLKSRIKELKDIVITWDEAISIFESFTLPKFISLTQKTFPNSDGLCDNAFGALVSLVFNRGSSMEGASRVEMRNIRDIGVPKKDYKYIASQVIQMKRLWPNTKGLLRRRDAEASLILTCAK